MLLIADVNPTTHYCVIILLLRYHNSCDYAYNCTCIFCRWKLILYMYMYVLLYVLAHT